jgi:antitoxin component YwqK of YwqJK toxin-antitoxin module
MNFIRTNIIVVFLFISTLYFAQEKVWIDADWKTTSKEKATYFKETTLQNRVLTYYFKNGKIAKKETYENRVLEGDYSEFYESGNLKETGKYDNGKRDGIWKTYYENGKINVRGKYREGDKVGVWKTYYKNDY